MESAQNKANVSEMFAMAQQISSQIDQDRMQEVIERVNSLKIEDKMVLVNLLGTVLEKNQHLLKNPDRVLLLLTTIGHTSANILARNRIIKPECVILDTEQSPDVYKILGEPSVYIRVVKRGMKDAPELFSERLIAWAHLSHVNVLPLYGALLDGEDGPISLVSPRTTKGNIVEYAGKLPQALRMPLISDVISGLCYLHHLKIIHGGLSPQNVHILDNGRACLIDLDAYSMKEPDTSIVRYSAPEILGDEDPIPTQAADVWSLGCLIYEVLSGKVPFHQQKKVLVAVVTGKKPSRPGHEGGNASEIDDTIWRSLTTCWEFQAEDRPTCSQFQKAFSSPVIHDDRPTLKPTVCSEAFQDATGSAINIDIARSILTQILGSNTSIPPPSQIPDHLRERLSGIIGNRVKAETVAVAASKLSPGDTQTLLNALDLLWEELPDPAVALSPIRTLIKKTMISTHMIPERYKINPIQYDSAPLAEGNSGKLYKGLDLDVCVILITNPADVSIILEYLAFWAHSPHPNFLPLYGVFHENIDELPRLCLVLPYLMNGTLRDYAPLLQQKDRIPLIYDVFNALTHMERLNFCPHFKGDQFLVSDVGRAILVPFVSSGVQQLLAHAGTTRTPGSYALRFRVPENLTNNVYSVEQFAWYFGCMVYELLSRKPPYYQYLEESDIRSALTRKEVPKRPESTEHDIDKIDDQFWDLILGCCMPNPGDRLTLPEIQMFLRDMSIKDERPEATGLPGTEVLARRSSLAFDWENVKHLLDQIQVELLRSPLSNLIQNHTKDVTASAVKYNPGDVQVLIDFLDLMLKNHITLSNERNRVLALLSRITTITHIFPNEYKLDGIKYHSLPIAEGGFGAVHRGNSDPTICVKVMSKVDSNALVGFVKELVLWAHSSHPNVLPFYGVFVDEMKRICLVSPFMNKGNLHNYAPRLAQKKRIPLLRDIVKGLIYLHGLGVVHTDLKGENVLISDEGRGLITDFGASHVITATAKGGPTTAAVASTLRFTPPEIVLDRHARPTQECDIWSLGCLFYEVLSRKLPYFEYSLDAQIISALMRGQLPTRPGSPDDNTEGEDWDDLEDPDWDEIDDAAWAVILSCWALKSEDRPKASRVEELIIDLKVWDDRPEAKGTFGTRFLKSRSSPDVDLNRAGDLLNELQIQLLAQSTLRCPTEDVVLAVSKVTLDNEDKWSLVDFWDVVFKQQLFTSENVRVLALLAALLGTFWVLPATYMFPTPMAYNRVPMGSGSFGTVHQGSDPNLCIKVTNFQKLDTNLSKQWLKVFLPSVYFSHPNVLPLYGTFRVKSLDCLVYPFVRNGDLCKYIPRVPQTARVLLILDVVEAVVYLHSLGVVHGNLKGENVLISDEGRALVTDFRPYHINIAAAGNGPIGPFVTSTLRFTAPELVKNSAMLPTPNTDIWSIGCLIYLVLSQQVPFNKYSQDAEIRSALSRGEVLERPVPANNDTDMIDDSFWNLISKCCAPEPAGRPALLEIRKFLMDLNIHDNRPPPKLLPGAELFKSRTTNPGVDMERIKGILSRINAHLPPVTEGGEEKDEN